MAKFRRNHNRQGGGASGSIIKVGIFSAVIGGLFFLFYVFSKGGIPDEPFEDNTSYADKYFLPTSPSGEVIHHKYYTLSYSEEHEQAEWVAYVLTKEKPDLPWVERSQSRNFNKGIWRELEELSRNWAKKNGKLYVVTGPVLSVETKGSIGENEVSVPACFFKVLLDVQEPELKGIAFLIPNQVIFEPLYEFAVSIDEVESATGIDFFNELLPDDLEEELERSYHIDLWEFSRR